MRQQVPLPIDTLVIKALRRLHALIREPREYRERWQFHHPDDTEADDGLIERTGDGKDWKFFFHWRPDLAQLLQNRGVPYHRYADLLDLSQTIYCHCESVAEDILMSVDRAVPGCQIWPRLRQCPEDRRHTLRLLVYKPGTNMLAKPHYDRSFLTLHAFETHDGLILGEKQEPYHMTPNHALAFFGFKAQIQSKGLLQSPIHYVVPTSVKQRSSVVFFSHIRIDMPVAEFEVMIKDIATKYVESLALAATSQPSLVL